MGSGPSLAANLRDSDGAAIFYRSTSWNRNRITNGMNYVITRAGLPHRVLSLADADTVNNKISLVNEETPFANDLTQTASEQVAALQAQGVDAIICIATPGVDTAALQNHAERPGRDRHRGRQQQRQRSGYSLSRRCGAGTGRCGPL